MGQREEDEIHKNSRGLKLEMSQNSPTELISNPGESAEKHKRGADVADELPAYPPSC